MSDRFVHACSRDLRDLALAFPETSEGSSCVNRAFKVRKKNFLFVGERGEDVKVMVELGPSLDRASALSATDSRIQVGKFGWTTLLFSAATPLDAALLASRVDESFRLLAPKAVVKQLPSPPPT